MTTVTILRRQDGSITGFEAKGHAMYAENGADIVCAGISAILQTAVLGITEVLKLDAGYELSGGQAALILSRECDKQKEADIVLETMLCGLKSLQMAHGEYLSIKERRCK